MIKVKEKEFHLVVSEKTHLRIMRYKLNYGLKSMDAIIRSWLDSLEKEEENDPYSLNYVEKENIINSENQTYNSG